MECDRLKLVIVGHFFALLPPSPPHKNAKNHFTHVYQKPHSYEVWFLRYRVRQTEFFVILGHFLPFYLPNNPENQNFEKMKKTYRDIIILHVCTKITII